MSRISNEGWRDLWETETTIRELLVRGSCSMYASWPLVVYLCSCVSSVRTRGSWTDESLGVPKLKDGDGPA